MCQLYDWRLAGTCYAPILCQPFCEKGWLRSVGLLRKHVHLISCMESLFEKISRAVHSFGGLSVMQEHHRTITSQYRPMEALE